MPTALFAMSRWDSFMPALDARKDGASMLRACVARCHALRHMLFSAGKALMSRARKSAHRLDMRSRRQARPTPSAKITAAACRLPASLRAIRPVAAACLLFYAGAAV